MTTRIIVIILLIALPFFIYSQAHATSTEDFIGTASIAGKFEVDSSKLALTRSSNDSIKVFAQKMIDDHTAASAKLKEAVKTAGKDEALVKTELDTKHQNDLDKLTKADAKDFDKDYISLQKDAHEEAVSLFKDYSTNGDDKTIKQFASETLPTLQSHLDHVKKLDEDNNK